jgi:hypothetical protein
VSTSELITRLSDELTPVRPGGAARRLMLGIGGGTLVTAVLMLVWLGPRPDLAEAVRSWSFWVKAGATAAAAVTALIAVGRLARPAGRAGATVAAMLAIAAALVLLAAIELGRAPPSAYDALVLGDSAMVCPLYIVALSLPIALGSAWALRGLAPTRLGAAGGAMGLFAGAAAAFIYSIHCTETAMSFLALWYGLGIALVGAIGAALGPRVLRW